MVDKLLSKLSQNLLEILNDEDFYDVTIEVGNDPYVKIFRAHMVILNYRSPYLQRILSTNKKKNDGALAHIKLPNILPEIFNAILRYIYGGNISLDEYDDMSDIVKILKAASEFGLQELINYLQSYLIENKKNWMEQNFSLIYQTSFKHDSFLEFQKFCTNLIANDPGKIFKSLDFISIPEKFLVSLIQDDNLQANEAQVWEHVLKWGLAQNPELPSDPADFSKDDFNALKETLQQCIPFIRFYNLTSKEFMEKVIPYKKILPKELYKDLLNTFLSLLDPDSKPDKKSNSRMPCINKEIDLKTVESKIITYQHAELISKWIDKLEITDMMENSYEFRLLFRGSRDEPICRKFHEICDGKSHTVTIVKVQGSNEILGGYNPIMWKSDNSFSTTKSSFVFSFENNNSIENYILSRVIDEKKAIFNGSQFGPSFGDNDLKIWGFFFAGGCYSAKTSYEKPIRKSSTVSNAIFHVEECEVFKLYKIEFKYVGVRDEIGVKDLISIIKNVVKEDINKALDTNEIISIIRILEQITKIRKENKREGNIPEKLDGLLIPCSENILVDLHEILYDDMGGRIGDGDKSKYKLAHRLVTSDIAEELGLQTLAGKIFGIDYDGGDINWDV